MAARRRRRANSGSSLGVLFCLLFVVWLIVKLIWWILGAAALEVLFLVLRAGVRENRKRRDTLARYCAETSPRAAPPMAVWAVRNAIQTRSSGQIMTEALPRAGRHSESRRTMLLVLLIAA